jgi:hypothetical protein
MTLNYDPIIVEQIFRPIQERFNLVLTLDPHSDVPRFEDTGIPGAVQEYLEALRTVCDNSLQLMERQDYQNGTQSEATDLTSTETAPGAPMHPLTPTFSPQSASDASSSRHGAVTPLDNQQILGSDDAHVEGRNDSANLQTAPAMSSR